jgi:hypothetical protein
MQAFVDNDDTKEDFPAIRVVAISECKLLFPDALAPTT